MSRNEPIVPDPLQMDMAVKLAAMATGADHFQRWCVHTAAAMANKMRALERTVDVNQVGVEPCSNVPRMLTRSCTARASRRP